MALASWLHRVGLRLFGAGWDGSPEPPVGQLERIAEARAEEGEPLTDEWAVRLAASAWLAGFEAGWLHEER